AHGECVSPDASAVRFDVLEGKAPAEHCESVEQRLLLAREEVVGPVDGCLQCLMAFAGGARFPGEESESLAEVAQDLWREHRARPACRKQDREWNAVELIADRDDVIVI